VTISGEINLLNNILDFLLWELHVGLL
jgi:hypothetical protein